MPGLRVLGFGASGFWLGVGVQCLGFAAQGLGLKVSTKSQDQGPSRS